MELIHRGPFSDVGHFALDLFEYFLYNGLFLKIVDLLLYLLTMNVQHRLTVKEKERSRYAFILALFTLVAFDILHEHLTQGVTVDAQF